MKSGQILQGITVIDLTRMFPGPLATSLLAQLGAHVIKIEHPSRRDLARDQPPFVDGESTLYQALNSGKEVRSVDFGSEAGKEKILEWVSGADVVIEQFRPGVMDAWGLGYEVLKAIKPDLIYLALSGYGQDGPYRDLAGHDINYMAYSGALSLTRDRHGAPVIPGLQVADAAGGSYIAFSACLSALLHRERTGEGCFADVSMLEGILPLLTIPATQYWGGFDPYQVNFLSGALVNYNLYCCRDGKWVALGALELKFWNNFCEFSGRDDWKRSSIYELSVHVFPKNEVEDLFASRARDEWMALAHGKDVCLSPVQSMEEAMQDPHIRHRNGVSTFTGAQGHTMHRFSIPFKIR